ncbi:hypothetical protein F2Q69_00037834 [Brassica cretica]|uniref:Uncharacterized protein n=1 Tax=Brassica cretica TaxID=69181 RepID=A0A8S9SMC0_BRACR|nr:hypothetical protein F2Q69_00037834 [Brassica cretica]
MICSQKERRSGKKLALNLVMNIILGTTRLGDCFNQGNRFHLPFSRSNGPPCELRFVVGVCVPDLRRRVNHPGLVLGLNRVVFGAVFKRVLWLSSLMVVALFQLLILQACLRRVESPIKGQWQVLVGFGGQATVTVVYG